MFKNFFRGMVLGLVLLAIAVPNANLKLSNRPSDTALAVGVEPVANTLTAEIKPEEDRRVEILTDYFKSKNSPLAEFAETFVTVADAYGFDYRFLPAIAGIESNFGRVQLEDSYNPFGWDGGYAYFESFDEAIHTVAFELYERCFRFGVDTPSEIGPSYCPPNYHRWIAAVEGVMEEISS